VGLMQMTVAHNSTCKYRTCAEIPPSDVNFGAI
jgi:hypothetical protein